MKTILVTGANRGIGLEICRQLSETGHTVILCSIDIEKGRAAAAGLGDNVYVRQLDITDSSSINNLYNSVLSDFGTIDVLINNAGKGEIESSGKRSLLSKTKSLVFKRIPYIKNLAKSLSPFLKKNGIIPKDHGAADVSIDRAMAIMNTNMFGAWRMIQKFVPLLIKSEDPRIINISSGMGQFRNLTGYYPAYSLSKASLNALTVMFANELKDKGFKVNAMCPGWVRSDMGGPDAPRSLAEGADTAVWLATFKEIPTGKFFKDRKETEW